MDKSRTPNILFHCTLMSRTFLGGPLKRWTDVTRFGVGTDPNGTNRCANDDDYILYEGWGLIHDNYFFPSI